MEIFPDFWGKIKHRAILFSLFLWWGWHWGVGPLDSHELGVLHSSAHFNIQWLFLVPLTGGIGGIVHPPIGSIIIPLIYHLYSPCLLVGYLYATYLPPFRGTSIQQPSSTSTPNPPPPRPRQMPLTGQYGRQGWDPHIVDTIRPQMPGYRAFFPGKKLLAWIEDGDIDVKHKMEIYRYIYYLGETYVGKIYVGNYFIN